MHIHELPTEIISSILLFATQANEAEGPTYTYGLTKVPIPWAPTQPPLARYVRGPVTAEALRWDATESIRQVCSAWHDWSLSYNFEHVYELRWRGNEKWADLTMQRRKYPFYELNTTSQGVPVWRDPYGSLKRTDRLFSAMPSIANHVRRLWFSGFPVAQTDKLMLSVIASCSELEYLSAPWTILRRGSVDDWVDLLNNNTGVGRPLHSLELTATRLTKEHAAVLESDETPNPLKDPRVDFSALKRLKIFGGTPNKPICDEDLQLIARTATNLECLDLTNLDTISVAGMLAIVKASRNTLEVLEHSPRSNDGFYHPFPGSIDEHVCQLISSLPKMRDLSMSVPYMCARLFANHEVKWRGDCQVRTVDICQCGLDTSAFKRAEKLRETFDAARELIAARRRLGHKLNIEIFFADCIFYPEEGLVHGNFELAEVSSARRWPRYKQASTKGPYGTSGLYDKEEERSWDVVSEKEYLTAVSNNWVAL